MLKFTGPHRSPSPRSDWLALVHEDILEPDLPIVDAHHHIWEQEGNVYGLPELHSDLSDGHNIVATVVVEAHAFYRKVGPKSLRSVGETETLIGLLKNAPDLAAKGYCQAIVANVDLTLGTGVEDVIETHLQAAPNRVRGVRHMVCRDPHYPKGITIAPAPECLLKQVAYRDGLRTLERLGMNYDAMLYHSQLSDLVETVELVPDLSVVLDHYGMPLGVGPYVGRSDEVFSTWRTNIRRLAEFPNVTVKLGGLGMILTGANWHENPLPPTSKELMVAWRPWFEACLEAFGAERCMFESNFPVDKGMFSYRTLWNSFKRLARGMSLQEQKFLFHDTACRVYHLNVLGEGI